MSKKIVPVPPEYRTESYWSRLNNIIDPEIGIGIVDLGLIYNIELKEKSMIITMTLTSMGCPFGATIIEQIKEEMKELPKVKKVSVNLVWDPVWTPNRINPEIRSLLPV